MDTLLIMAKPQYAPPMSHITKSGLNTSHLHLNRCPVTRVRCIKKGKKKLKGKGVLAVHSGKMRA